MPRKDFNCGYIPSFSTNSETIWVHLKPNIRRRNLTCWIFQSNSSSRAARWRPSVHADWGGGVSACCTAGPVVCWRGHRIMRSGIISTCQSTLTSETVAASTSRRHIYLLGGIALVQAIPPMATHFSVVWSVYLSSVILTLLKPFDGFACHLAWTHVGSNNTLC